MADGIRPEPAVHRTAGSLISTAHHPLVKSPPDSRKITGGSRVWPSHGHWNHGQPREPCWYPSIALSWPRWAPGRSCLVCGWAAECNDRPRINLLPAGRCRASFRRPLT